MRDPQPSSSTAGFFQAQPDIRSQLNEDVSLNNIIKRISHPTLIPSSCPNPLPPPPLPPSFTPLSPALTPPSLPSPLHPTTYRPRYLPLPHPCSIKRRPRPPRRCRAQPALPENMGYIQQTKRRARHPRRLARAAGYRDRGGDGCDCLRAGVGRLGAGGAVVK